jgi:RNA polymerase sigma factor (sigma-70 family)
MNELRIYKKQISKKYKKLSNEELLELYKNDKTEELINSLLPMVIDISAKFQGIDKFEDIVQSGNMGLMNGIKNFDINKSDRIISVCHNYIRFSILDYLNFESRIIKLPLSNRKIVSQRTIDLYPTVSYSEDLMEFDSEDEVYVEPKISRKEMEDLLTTIPNMKYSKIQVFLDYIFIKGITLQVISEKQGYSKQNVSLIIKDTISKIKKDKRILQRIGDMLKIN